MKWRFPKVDRATAFIAVGALLLGVLYMTAAAWVDAHFADTTPSTSSLSTSSEGLKVWSDYLTALGLHPSTLTDFSSLPASATIIIAGPFEKPPTAADGKRLAAWVRAGGRAVIVGLDEGGVSGAIGSLGGDESADDSSVVEPSYPGVYASGVTRILAGAGRLEPGDDDTAWVDLYHDSNGSSLISRRLGTGEVVWLADVTPVSNDGIGLDDDAALAVRIAASGGRAIYFDEYHHGITSEPTAWGRLGSSGQAALVLLVLGVGVFLFAMGRRTGPAIARPQLPAARGGAYIAQLAELYRTAGARAEALASVEDGVVRALVRRYGDRASGLARQPKAREAIEASAALRARGAIRKDEFVAAAQSLRAARKEVEGGNG